jgi:hypothetical protein
MEHVHMSSSLTCEDSRFFAIQICACIDLGRDHPVLDMSFFFHTQFGINDPVAIVQLVNSFRSYFAGECWY